MRESDLLLSGCGRPQPALNREMHRPERDGQDEKKNLLAPD